MDIFERRFKQQHRIDDTQRIRCVIETAQEVNGHTEYLLRLQRESVNLETWRIFRRYNEFAELNKCLATSGIDVPFPGKRLFGNMRADFIAERRQALQLYINKVLMNPILASSLPAKRFVDPDSYSQSFYDQAVQNALLCLRNDAMWSLGPTLGAIGWRLKKHYFKVIPKPPDTKSCGKSLVKSGSQTHSQFKHATAGSNGSRTGSYGDHSTDNSSAENNEQVLEWLEYGPDKYVEDKELTGILKSLIQLKHPNIEPIVHATHNENGCMVIRKFHKHGSLKDILCMATPKNPFLCKYGNPKGRTALSMKQVASYGKQILDVLSYLQSKGYPYGHLHSGNVVIVDDVVKLLDVENFVLGVPSFYRPFFVQHSKIHKPEAIDVYCFGHVLFEMAMGYPLQESVIRNLTDCPDMLKNLLECILSKEACRSGLPTLEQLHKHDFFKQYTSKDSIEHLSEESNKTHLKLSLNAKDAINAAVQRAECRLRDEQKSVKNQKRIVRVQELMSSEEEKRKTKHKAKQEYKMSKLKQQSSLQNSNDRVTTTSVDIACTAELPDTSPCTLSRVDSVAADNHTQDATSDLKSPPATPSAFQKCRQSEGQQHARRQQMPSSSSGPTPHLVIVDRQSSSPNISSEDQGTTDVERSALLESICKFNRGSLRKVRSND